MDNNTNLTNQDSTNRRDAAIRVTMMPRDTNAHGTIFGGIILSYIDIAGGVEAVRYTSHPRFVTIAMREIKFHEPVFVGDLVSFYAETTHVGNTSITIRIWVESERFNARGVTVRVTEAEVIYVAVDENRNKVSIGKPENATNQ
ncbi:MAG: acyl-CoA thioesterase [Pyrinomonadaceae bacterium]|nr:acyl-CoA thioesterase [Pyrinomonadaceae bacterium]